MRSTPRILIAAMAALIGSGVAACGDATRALSPDREAPAEQQEQGKDLQLAVRGELRSYPEHVIADFETEFSPSITSGTKGLSYEWVFGDGKRVSGAKASHVFADTGKQEVILRVTNSTGQVTQLTQTVQISAGISQLGTVLSGIVAGGIHTCAINALSALYCWGTNANGTVGDGTTTDRLLPVQVGTQLSFSQVATGFAHSCALTLTGEAYCWGRNYAGQLGDGTTVDRLAPTAVLGGLAFSSIDVGFNHSCALTTAGLAYCWGGDDLGQLGNGSTASSQSVPTQVSGGRSFSVIRSGLQHTCALEASTGAAYCWGSNAFGQLGNGSGGASDTDNVTSPVAVAGGQSFTQLDAGASHNCAIANKFTYCWGFNGIGQLGVSTNETCAGGKACSRTPARLAANLKFSAISLGSSHSCGLIGATGQTYCWGYNRTGQLGDGTTTSRTQPALINGPAMKSLHLGGSFSCGVGVDNLAYCWGLNYYGALGVGDRTDRVVPTPVSSLTF